MRSGIDCSLDIQLWLGVSGELGGGCEGLASNINKCFKVVALLFLVCSQCFPLDLTLLDIFTQYRVDRREHSHE